MAVNKVVYGTTVLVDLTNDTVRADKLAAGITAHDAAGNLITGVLDVVSPKVHLDQGVMYAPAANAYYRVKTVSDQSVNFDYYGGSGCEQIVYPITGLVPGCTYTIPFTETYNGGFIGDSYWYGCGIMQEAEYNATTFPVNAGQPSFITWKTATAGTQSGSLTFTAKTTKAYWVWSMARIQDSKAHDITFTVKAQASGLSLQDKTVTENGVVQADSGYDGLGTVTVNVTPEEVILQSKRVDVSENGTLTVTPDEGYNGLASVDVTVAVNTGGETITNNEDLLLTRNISGSYYNDRISAVGEYAFSNCDLLTSVDLPNVTRVYPYAFYQTYKLTTFNLPSVKELSNSAFYGSGITLANCPLIVFVPGYAFQSCSKLVEAIFPKVTRIDAYAFSYCPKLTALVLQSETMCTLSSANAFDGSGIAAGTGYIYVPSALVSSYKSATNWSNYATQIRALEDYTVDGTITGALDESKI